MICVYGIQISCAHHGAIHVVFKLTAEWKNDNPGFSLLRMSLLVTAQLLQQPLKTTYVHALVTYFE
jgi:hypothetical protein